MNNSTIKLTPLRQAVLDIFNRTSKPLKAYQILTYLQRIRPNAKPATVYRVLEFLVNCSLLHRLDSCQSYTLCTLEHINKSNQQIILLCVRCQTVAELADPIMDTLVMKLAAEHRFKLSHDIIELTGQCYNCNNTKT